MSLYDEWKKEAEKEREKEEYNKYWNAYFEKEKNIYEYLLENHETVVSGSLASLAEKFKIDNVLMTGFMDGINTSLEKEIDIEVLTPESELTLKIDFEKLFYNMLDAKAEWLHTLPQWEDVLSKEIRSEITKEYRKANIAVRTKVGRNDPCTCGSGKKYKKCCGVEE